MVTDTRYCLDCKFNQDVNTIDGAVVACWTCITTDGEKLNFEPRVNNLKPPTPEVSAFGAQVGGKHYTDMKTQPIEFATANNLNPCQTLALRYLTRKKGDKIKRIEDRHKAIHVIQLEIEMIQNGVIDFE